MKKFLTFFLLSFSLLFLTGCDSVFEVQTQTYLDDIHKEVATDFVEQYNIAKRQGDPMQICVQAGLVSSAYLQAKDEKNYQKWKDIEKADCERAGLPY